MPSFLQWELWMATILSCAHACAMSTQPDNGAPGVSSSSVFMQLEDANLTTHEEFAFAYIVQGLVNQNTSKGGLFYNTSKMDFDFPASDANWLQYLSDDRGLKFNFSVPSDVCSLLQYFDMLSRPAVSYQNSTDGVTLYIAATIAGVTGSLPVSDALASKFHCLRSLTVSETIPRFTSKLDGFKWAVKHWQHRTNPRIVFNADMYPNAVPMQGLATVMSLDYVVMQRGFIMNLSPLWQCDPLDCGPNSTRRGMPKETELYVQVIQDSDELVEVWGWGDPEHAYTNITSHAGGVVFCSFSAPNFSFWSLLARAFDTKPKRIPVHDLNHTVDRDKTYLLFETNEGDTPRILSSQFTSAWLSKNRGSVPVGWALDPLLGLHFPDLWNFYMDSATMNDTFVNGVDGSGYVFIDSLGSHMHSYVTHAVKNMEIAGGPNVVDVGVASAKWPATLSSSITNYSVIANSIPGARSPDMFLNACGTAWSQPINYWLSDGTPVINSVCHGPANDTSDGHYLYYYRSHLNEMDSSADLASRIEWASTHYKEPNKPLFLVIFGGLGLYGGNDDFFLFLQRTFSHIESDKYVAVGAQEFARLALSAHKL